MLVIAGNIDQIFKSGDVDPNDYEDPYAQLLRETRNWLLSRASIFWPPGGKKKGAVNLDSWRSLNKHK